MLVCLSVFPLCCLLACLLVRLVVHLVVWLSASLSLCRPVALFVCLFVRPFDYLSVCLCVFVCRSLGLSVCRSVRRSSCRLWVFRFVHLLMVGLPLCCSFGLPLRSLCMFSPSGRPCACFPSAWLPVCVCLSVCMAVGLRLRLSVCACVYLSVRLFVCLFVRLLVCPFVRLFGSRVLVCLCVCLSLSGCMPVCLSGCLSVCVCLPPFACSPTSLSVSVFFRASTFFCTSVSLPLPLRHAVSVCLFVRQLVCLSVCLFVGVCLSVCLSVCVRVRLSICLLDCRSVCPPVCHACVRLGDVCVPLLGGVLVWCLFGMAFGQATAMQTMHLLCMHSLLQLEFCANGMRALGDVSVKTPPGHFGFAGIPRSPAVAIGVPGEATCIREAPGGQCPVDTWGSKTRATFDCVVSLTHRNQCYLFAKSVVSEPSAVATGIRRNNKSI